MKEVSAGGVVYRKRDGQIQLLMIEDRYGKMTLAKGKQEPGETLEETALREILEETGVRGKLIAPIEIVRYQYQHPQTGETVHKEVHYYLVEALTDEVTAQIEEINAVQWLPPREAWERQQAEGYLNNESVLRRALAQLKIEV